MSSPEREGNLLFPVFLKLEELNLLIVGGGNVGLEKLSAVLRNSPGAPVTLVSREMGEGVRELAAGTPTCNSWNGRTCPKTSTARTL
jgi:siroheme synthase (precorrin-2 oxidase/ferrochelatase)